jgi:hypothetical protein
MGVSWPWVQPRATPQPPLPQPAGAACGLAARHEDEIEATGLDLHIVEHACPSSRGLLGAPTSTARRRLQPASSFAGFVEAHAVLDRAVVMRRAATRRAMPAVAAFGGGGFAAALRSR